MATSETIRRAGADLDDKEVAEIRAVAAARVAGFPPLSREQAVLVRAALTGRSRPDPVDDLT